MFFRKIFGKLLFSYIFRWKPKVEVSKNVLERCVLIAAPHTSNWDYPITMSYMWSQKIKISYTIKKEWMRFPLGIFFRFTGGVGIDRKPKNKGKKRLSMVESISKLFGKHSKLCVIVPAEGSRSLRRRWKTGFYYIALTASVPIVLGYLDYKTKIAGIGRVIHPTGNLYQDMTQIMKFYEGIQGKSPKQFALDERFCPTPENKTPQMDSDQETIETTV